jgi:hypothetical protein
MDVGPTHVGSGTIGAFVDLVLPPIESVVAAIPPDLVESEEELYARVRLSYLNAHVKADTGEMESAIAVLRARASGSKTADPFGRRIAADSFEALADLADRAFTEDRLDLPTVLGLMYESGSIAARHGRRLIVFLGLSAHVRRAIWDYGSEQVERLGLGHAQMVELGRWLLLSTEMASLAIGEGYRATERELLARDAAAHRAALDELLGAEPTTARAALRLRRLAVRYGLDPDATYRVAAIVPGAEADPTPETPGLDEADLQNLAERIDQLLRRRPRTDVVASGIRIPLAITWRGSIVAILSDSPREWQRLQEATRTVVGRDVQSWTAIAVAAAGVGEVARALAELQEGVRVASEIGRHGVIDDLSELAMERLLLSDPDLAAVIVKRELGPLLADKRMGDELIETLQTYFDCGFNRRETARRLHLADRTVAYRLERIEDLLGHGLEDEAGRRLELALTLRRLERSRTAGK